MIIIAKSISEDHTFELIKIISRVVSTRSESMNAFWTVLRPGFVGSLNFTI